MPRCITALLLILLLSFACTFDSENQDEKEIRDIIYDISRDFNWNDLGGIMEYVHPNFLHNGMYGFELEQLWQNRKAQYQLLTCQITDVEIDGDFATVFMTMTYESSTATDTFIEPTTHGDASYFHYDAGSWQLFGNQTR